MKAAADVRDDMWGWEPTKERVLLVGVGGQKGDERADQYGMEASLAELAQLADTAGLEVVGTVTQRLRAPHPGTYVGKGKLGELRRACGLPSDATKAEASAEEEEEEEEPDDAFSTTTTRPRRRMTRRRAPRRSRRTFPCGTKTPSWSGRRFVVTRKSHRLWRR